MNLETADREVVVLKTKSAPSARSAFDFIVGLNFSMIHDLPVIAVMIVIVVAIVLVVLIVPVAITVPAVSFHVPPPMRVRPAVFPRIV
jgi:hypothetical protein